jgi:mevalonate pyrophosphate decarboxylase
MIKEFNNHSKVKVGYTFDAGPHALLLIHESSFTNFVVWITTLCISIDIQLDNIANVICNEKFR